MIMKEMVISAEEMNAEGIVVFVRVDVSVTVEMYSMIRLVAPVVVVEEMVDIVGEIDVFVEYVVEVEVVEDVVHGQGWRVAIGDAGLGRGLAEGQVGQRREGGGERPGRLPGSLCHRHDVPD